MGRSEKESVVCSCGGKNKCGVCRRNEIAVALQEQARSLGINNDDLMQEAWELTNGDRHAAYGSAVDVFTAYGHAWSAILAAKLKPGVFIDAADATLMMAVLKICREAHKVKRDNVVDAHGYLSLHSRVTGLLKKEEK